VETGQVEKAKMRKNTQVTNRLRKSSAWRMKKFPRPTGTDTVVPSKTAVLASTARRMTLAHHRMTGVKGT
jgi:hypothetical protein